MAVLNAELRRARAVSPYWWINHKVCDTWPVRCQTYGHLQGRSQRGGTRAMPPIVD